MKIIFTKCDSYLQWIPYMPNMLLLEIGSPNFRQFFYFFFDEERVISFKKKNLYLQRNDFHIRVVDRTCNGWFYESSWRSNWYQTESYAAKSHFFTFCISKFWSETILRNWAVYWDSFMVRSSKPSYCMHQMIWLLATWTLQMNIKMHHAECFNRYHL